MIYGSLFTGGGGFDIAAENIGWDIAFHCEINKFCQKILKYYWPNAESYEDIKKTDFTKWRNRIDVLSGGFPCQPWSNAGKQKGKDDNRHLWPEMLRAVREIQPRWVVGENVLGLLNWRRGMVLDEIRSDLEVEGFEVFPPLVLPACAKNALHRRDRVWIIAHNNSSRQLHGEFKIEPTEGGEQAFSNTPPSLEDATNTFGDRLQGKLHQDSGEKTRASEAFLISQLCTEIEQLPKPYTLSANDGLPVKLDGIAFSKWRSETIKLAGNAIVWEIAGEIFRTIEKFEKLKYGEDKHH